MAGKPEKEYIAEYSKSDRAGCKICSQKIAKLELRIGRYIQSPHFDGWVPNWHHSRCFFSKKKIPITTTSEIAGFMDLQFTDQQQIKAYISGTAQPAAEEAGAKGSKSSGGGGGASEFQCEYAKSGKSKCRLCENPIETGAIRLGPMEKMDRAPFLPVARWHHVDCFFKAGTWPNVTPSDIDGFNSLNKDDQESLTTRLGGKPAKSDGSGAKAAPAASQAKKGKRAKKDESDSDDEPKKGKKRAKKGDDDSDDEPKKGKKAKKKAAADSDEDAPLFPGAKSAAAAPPVKLSREEEAIKKHSEKLFAIRQKLRGVSTSVLKEVLEAVGQDSRGGDTTLQGRLADLMLHGVPEPCPKCGGRIKYEDGQYECTKWADEYAKCQFKAPTVKRLPFVMPKDTGDDYLDSFKFVKVAIPKALERELEKTEAFVTEKKAAALAAAAAAASGGSGGKALEEDAAEEETATDPTKCLEGLVFALHSTKSQALDKDALKGKIVGAGGMMMASVTKKVTHVLTTKDAHAQGGAAIAAAVKAKLPVVTEGFLDACIAAGKAVSEQPFLLAGEARKEPDGDEEGGGAGSKRKSVEEAKPKTMKILVKGKGAVDVDSGLADEAHILEKGKSVYSATLNRTDLSQGLNSFYVLQVIQTDSLKKTYLWRKWGRIGTDNKNDKLQEMPLPECVREFERLFEEKTGNSWDNRSPDRFAQMPGKFSVMELGLATEDMAKEQKIGSAVAATSKLPSAVAKLIQLIFDVDMMRKTMMEMEIDISKMPLGALSRTQIQRGYNVLTDIQSILDDKSMEAFDRNQKLLSASNKFYTIIPQDFGSGGMSDLHRIDTLDKLKSKLELVESLLELEIAVSMQKTSGDAEQESVIDQHYAKLKTSMNPIQPSDPVFVLINTYLQNTHAKTHSSYRLELVDLFEIEREGERERANKFAEVKNRMLLWHGSRLTNWVGILSQGLRIAPPEAPVTGYMFGKVLSPRLHATEKLPLGMAIGVYFADMSSKSANYCFASKTQNEGLLLLSEVALGDLHEITSANSNLPKGLPKDKLSVKGCGRTAPDPDEFKTLPDAAASRAALDAPDSKAVTDGLTVPCGRGKDVFGTKRTDLQYNEYIVYDVAQVFARFLLRVKFVYP